MSFRRLRGVVLALVCVLSFVPSALAQCGGTERWPVKVAADPDAGKVDLGNRVLTKLADLVAIARPQLPSTNDDDTRLPEERTVRIVEGRLVKFKLESGKTGDRDYHLVISDDTLQFSGAKTAPSPHSFIAEVVDPDCIGGRDGDPKTRSTFQDQLVAVRNAFDQQFPSITGGWNEAKGIPVRITGVGFFDRQHGQVGRAPNGIEIHPILEILFNPGAITTTPPTPSALANGGFEDGATGWTASADVITNDPREPAHGGQWKAWLGGYGKAHEDKVSQRITIPATAQTVTLRFYLHVSTEEQGQEAYDKLRLRLRKSDGTFLKTLKTYSNLQARPGFSLETVDLSAYRGQTLSIEWASQEDSSSMTSFIVDDIAILIQ